MLSQLADRIVLNWLMWKYPNPNESQAAFIRRFLVWFTKVSPATPPLQAERFIVAVNGVSVLLEEEHMSSVLPAEKRSKITVGSPVDKNGDPADIDGVPHWASSNESVLVVEEVAADGMSAYARNVGKGQAQVIISGDADLGPDDKEIMTAVDFVCQGLEAVGFDVTVGNPEDVSTP